MPTARCDPWQTFDKYRDNVIFEVIDLMHKRIHEGRYFGASKIFEDIASEGEVTALIRLGQYDLYCGVHASAGADAFTYMYEAPTVDDPGTAMTVTNYNRNYPSYSGELQVFHTPTVSDNGDPLLDGELICGGADKKAVGAGSRIREFFVLKKNTDYYVRLVNKGTGAEPMGLDVTAYENSESD